LDHSDSRCLPEMQALQKDYSFVRQMYYRAAGHLFMVEALDAEAAELISELFNDWYLSSEIGPERELPAAKIRISSGLKPPSIPADCQRFEIPDSGVCFNKGTTSYLELGGSLIAIGAEGDVDIEVWVNNLFEQPLLTRVVSYALSAALRRCQLFELHSAAVVEPRSGKGVLIVGSSGSGKTTLTVQLSEAGWPYLSDDVLLLHQTESRIEAWPVRRCFAITGETFASSPFLQSRLSLRPFTDPGSAKQRFSPQVVFSSEFRDNCTPQTIFFTQVGEAEISEVLSLSRAETMSRLIRMNPWSCYDKNTASEHLAVLAHLARQSQGYALRAGRDLLEAENSSRLLTNYVNR
jgi:energy-coupling factor transporter ATP-binding protein EcfA2